MSLSRQPYRQALPDLELSIERGTKAVPDDGYFHLRRAGEELGRYRSLKAAQGAWQEVVRESGWKPEPRATDPAEVRRREQSERWARNRAG
jgi:hypothetical protein